KQWILLKPYPASYIQQDDNGGYYISTASTPLLRYRFFQMLYVFHHGISHGPQTNTGKRRHDKVDKLDIDIMRFHLLPVQFKPLQSYPVYDNQDNLLSSKRC